MAETYPPLQPATLPPAPHWSKAIGVGVVVMGLSIGTGELIMWPHLVAKHGLTLLWAALLGITFQYFINQEVARHAAATGESFFTSSARVIRWLPPLWLAFAVVLYIWPGWASALGTTLRELTGFGTHLGWALASLGLVLVLTLSGRVAYLVLERTLKVVVPAFFVLLIVASFSSIQPQHLRDALAGLLSFGQIPPGVDVQVLLGAIVFAGAGGLLNLCTSLWYRDKQIGMGAHSGRITNPLTGRPEAVPVNGFSFTVTPESLSTWRRWMRLVRIDQGLIFWLLGFVTLLLLSLNAYAVLTPLGLVPDGLDIAVVQAHIFGARWGNLGFTAFLVMAFLMLFSVMWTVIDAFIRICSDIIYVNSRSGPWRLYLGRLSNVSISYLYYWLLGGFLVVTALLLPLQQPLVLLTTSAVLGGLAMALYTPLLLYLNNAKLPPQLRPGLVTNVFLVAASLFYLGFFVYLVGKLIG